MANSPSEDTAGNEAGSTAPRDDAQHLREEIEQTRQQLGQTVEQLAAKVDVKSRARAQAAQLATRVKGTTARAQDPIRQAAAKGASKAREYRLPLALGTGALVLACLAIWQRRKR